MTTDWDLDDYLFPYAEGADMEPFEEDYLSVTALRELVREYGSPSLSMEGAGRRYSADFDMDNFGFAD